MSFSFSKGSRRNTECYEVSINEHTFGISYTTVIAYWGPLGNCRLANTFSNTTGRHFSDLGAKDLPIVEDSVMEAIIEKATARQKSVSLRRYKKPILTRFINSLALKTMTLPDLVGV